jgi:hypothetical protein
VIMGQKQQNRRLASARARPAVARPAHNPKDAASRIKAELGLSYRNALTEVDGFLRD